MSPRTFYVFVKEIVSVCGALRLLGWGSAQADLGLLCVGAEAKLSWAEVWEEGAEAELTQAGFNCCEGGL